MCSFDLLEQNWHWAKACHPWQSGVHLPQLHKACHSEEFLKGGRTSAFFYLENWKNMQEEFSYSRWEETRPFLFDANDYFLPPKTQLHKTVRKTQTYMLPPFEAYKDQEGEKYEAA